jgi:hypothetical protein
MLILYRDNFYDFQEMKKRELDSWIDGVAQAIAMVRNGG